MTIKELIQAEEKVVINWSEADLNFIVETIEAKLLCKKIENWQEGVILFFPKLYDYNQEVQRLIEQDPSLSEKIAKRYDLKDLVVVSFSPQSQAISADESTIPFKYEITAETKERLTKIYAGVNVKIEVRLILNKKNPYFYNEEKRVSEEQSVFKRFMPESNAALSLVLAGTVLSSLISPSVQMNIKSAIVKIEKRVFKDANAFDSMSEMSPQLKEAWNDFYQEINSKQLQKYAPTLAKLKVSEIADALALNNQIDSERMLTTRREKEKTNTNQYSERVGDIAEIISKYYKLSKEKQGQISQIAKAVSSESIKRNIDYKLMVAILKVESTFKQSATNSSGDLSVAQVNYNQWSKEFKRLGYPALNKERLKTDIKYSIQKMAEILEILASRHADDDDLWFARYHNRKPAPKHEYAEKIRAEIMFINKNKLKDIQNRLYLSVDELNGLKKIEDRAVSEDTVNNLIKHLILLAQSINDRDKKSPIVASAE